MPQEQAIIILSGGLDSTVSLSLALKDYQIILALTFDYGQRAAKREIQSARSLCEIQSISHQTISFPWLKEITRTALVNPEKSIPQLKISELDQTELTQSSAQKVWVPNRNGLFINVAACFADSLGASVLLTGFNQEEAVTFPDNSQEFAQAISQGLFYSTQVHARVESPTQHLKKEEIVAEGIRLNIPFEKIWSCYEGGEKMCGRCESCLRFKRALQKNNLMEKMTNAFEVG